MPARPAWILLRHMQKVYLLEGDLLDTKEVTAGETFDSRSAEELIKRTYNSPFLDGLSFAGGYDNLTDLRGPTAADGVVIPGPGGGGTP
jgi:hypothetical protein